MTLLLVKSQEKIINLKIDNNEEILAHSQRAQTINQHLVSAGKILAVKCKTSLLHFDKFWKITYLSS